MQTHLTVAQAIEQGYTHWIYSSDGFQGLMTVADIERDHFHKEIELIEKEPYHPAGLSEDDIIEHIADMIEEKHQEESGDDTLSVYNAIKELKCPELVELINRKLQGLNYYKSSGIILIPNPQ